MTVQKLFIKNLYEGDGANKSFPITFEWDYKHTERIKVYVRKAGEELRQAMDFSLTQMPGTDTWNVNYPVAGDALGAGEKIVIARELPLYQLLNLVNQGPYFAEDIELTFDEVVKMIQQLNEKLDRSTKLEIDIDSNFNATLPIVPGKSFKVNAAGTGFEMTDDPAEVKQYVDAELAQAVEVKTEAQAAQMAAEEAANKASAIASKFSTLDTVVVKCNETQALIVQADLDNKVAQTLTNANIATSKANEATNSANSANVQADLAANAKEQSVQILQNLNLIKNSGNADSISNQNAIDIININDNMGIIKNGGYYKIDLTYNQNGYINNSNGELVSYNGWHYTDYIPIEGKDIFVTTTAPSSTLYNAFYNADKTFIKPFNAASGLISDVPISARYVRMSCQSNYTQTLALSTEGLNDKVNEQDVLNLIGMGEDIVKLNKDVETYVLQTTSPRNSHFADSFAPLSFMHFSDVHAMQKIWDRIIKYAEHYKDYLKFLIHSGDYVGSYQGVYQDLYLGGETTSLPIYNVVGNHDTYSNVQGSLASKQSTYNLIFKHQDNWNVTAFMPGTNSMTYYKRFTDSNLTMFVLDNYYNQDEQVQWLRERLEAERQAGRHVITVMHEVSRRIVDKLDTGFQTINNYESLGGNGGNAQGVERVSPFDAIIAEFKTKGGIHVANFVGHEHTDMIGYTSTGVLNIAVESATNDVVWCDARRVEGTKTFDAFNVVTVNTNVGTLSLVRIGDNTDNYGRPRNVLCYDYINKNIITTH